MIRLGQGDRFSEYALALDDSDLLLEIEDCITVLWVLRAGRAHPTYPGVPSLLIGRRDVVQWRGHDSALAVYLTILIYESRARGLGWRVAPYSVPGFELRPGWCDNDLEYYGDQSTLPDWWFEYTKDEVI